MAKSYQSDAIEVLEGLEPVRKRPGMYTDTTRPNHLAQEVIDNCVDEALAGHANEIQVVLSKDQAMSISDNGRGMPVDIHKKEKVSGVELILTRLHSGAKFNNDQYRYSGGLHGVGVSVVNALSERFEVFVKRDGHLHHMAFKDGEMKSPLSIKESIGKRSTGTRIEFKPNPKYFDSHRFSVSRLKHLLRAKAVLCPGLKIVFTDETASDEERVTEWFYQDGLADYLSSEMQGFETLPAQPIVGQIESSKDAVDWAV
ncbi:MAG: ATP-binding protein, partial [Pseudomonadales bacterium]